MKIFIWRTGRPAISYRQKAMSNSWWWYQAYLYNFNNRCYYTFIFIKSIPSTISYSIYFWRYWIHNWTQQYYKDSIIIEVEITSVFKILYIFIIVSLFSRVQINTKKIFSHISFEITAKYASEFFSIILQRNICPKYNQDYKNLGFRFVKTPSHAQICDFWE